jgi:hypothetical protein
MSKRTFVPIAMLALTFAAESAAQSVVPDSTPVIAPAKPGVFERVIANEKKGEAALDVYERIERVETHKGPNDPSPITTKILRVIPSGTGMDRIAMGADGKPTDAGAYRAELQKLERSLTLLVSDGRVQRDGVEKFEKKKKERNELIEATRNAFLFTLLNNEPRGERTLLKYKMEPNPAFKPTSRFTTFFTKVHGFVWIDEESGQLARIEGEVSEDISVGLFLAKVYKGSHFMQERYEYFPGLWLASFSQYDFDGRKFFSGFSIHERTFYSNYRYIGPPKEALVAIRQELGHADLDKPQANPSNH